MNLKTVITIVLLIATIKSPIALAANQEIIPKGKGEFDVSTTNM